MNNSSCIKNIRGNNISAAFSLLIYTNIMFVCEQHCSQRNKTCRINKLSDVGQWLWKAWLSRVCKTLHGCASGENEARGEDYEVCNVREPGLTPSIPPDHETNLHEDSAKECHGSCPSNHCWGNDWRPRQYIKTTTNQHHARNCVAQEVGGQPPGYSLAHYTRYQNDSSTKHAKWLSAAKHKRPQCIVENKGEYHLGSSGLQLYVHCHGK